MAITTIDGAIAGMQPPREFVKAVTGTMVVGRPFSSIYLAGIPGPAVAPSPGIGGEVVANDYAGCLSFDNPTSGNTYLARLQGMATVAGSLLLCDRLWHNSGIDATNTSEQVFTDSARIPARDDFGLNNGDGVYAGVEVSTAMGSAAPTITLKYTNQAGEANKQATNIIATTTTSPIGTFFPIGLQSGDKGIQRVQSINLSVSWLSGVIHVVLYRVLARLELAANIPNAVDALTSGFVRLYDNTSPFIVFVPGTTTTSNISGHVIWTQG